MLSRQHALGTQVGILPIRFGQRIQFHRTSGLRSMDESPFADVDPGVADAGTTTGRKEQQVAGLQVLLADILRTHHDQFTRGTRQGDARGVTVNEADQATAIKPGVRRVAAPAIRRAHQTERAKQYVFSSGRE